MTDATVLAELWEVGVSLQNEYDKTAASNDPRAAEIKKQLDAVSLAYKKAVFEITKDSVSALDDAKRWLESFKDQGQGWPFGAAEAPFNHETPNRDNDDKVPAVVTPAGPAPAQGKALSDREKEYLKLWDSMTINDAWKVQAIAIAKKIVVNQSRYVAAVSGSDIPWWFVAIVHSMECSLRFDQHLHNGDPLTDRTVRIPAKRPANSAPPFTWESSARDALEYDDITKVTDWSLPSVLFLWHRYNGINNKYKQLNIPTPYLWSGTQHYKKGKYVKDGVFDPNVPSKQVGAATLLRTLIDINAVSFSNRQLASNVLSAVGSVYALSPLAPNSGMKAADNELSFPGSLSEQSGSDTKTKANITRLQEWLNLHNCSTPIDGGFGASTRMQLEKFQSRNGRLATGVLDEDTWTLLTAPMHRALERKELGASATIQQITVHVAQQHIQQSPREVGGDNMGPWVRLYMNGMQGEDQPWCAGFVCFIVAQAARDLGVPPPFRRQVGVDQLVDDAKKSSRFIDRTAVQNAKLRASKILPGTIYTFEGTPGDWTHCGIVKSVGEDTFDTFEGNTNGSGSANGNVAIESNRSFSKKDFIALI